MAIQGNEERCSAESPNALMCKVPPPSSGADDGLRTTRPLATFGEAWVESRAKGVVEALGKAHGKVG